jgi:hypothetical protein
MTLQELKNVARRNIVKWCNELPQDGDYKEPEVITDRMSGCGAPQDGDYVVIMMFHNRKEKMESEVSKW